MINQGSRFREGILFGGGAKTENENYLYELGYHIEGSTPGNIHDLVYFLKHITEYIEGKHIDLFLCEEACFIESLVLQSMAESKKIKYRTLGNGKINFSKIKRKISSAAVCHQCREIYRMIHSYFRYKGCRTSGSYEIAYLHSSDLSSRISRQKRAVNEVKNTFHTCVVCYNCDRAFDEFSEQNYTSDNLAGWLNMKKMTEAYINYLHDRKKLIHAVQTKLNVSVNAVDLTDVIIYLYIRYLNSEVLKNVLRYHMTESYLKENTFDLITGQGNSNFIEYRMFYHALRKQRKNSLFYRESRHIEAVNISGWKSYEPYADIFDFRIFSPNNKALNRLKDTGWKGEYYLCGLKSESPHLFFTNAEDKNKRVFLWAPSDLCSHFYSAARFIKDNRSVIGQCGNRNCTLYVKFHPRNDSYLYKRCRKMCSKYDNIILVRESEPIEGYIDQADIVITTPSLVIFDAAKHHKMVICLTDDPEKVAPLDEGFTVTDSGEPDLSYLLSHYTKEEIFEAVKKQSEFMDRYYYTKTDLAIEDILRMKIKEAREKCR